MLTPNSVRSNGPSTKLRHAVWITLWQLLLQKVRTLELHSHSVPLRWFVATTSPHSFESFDTTACRAPTPVAVPWTKNPGGQLCMSHPLQGTSDDWKGCCIARRQPLLETFDQNPILRLKFRERNIITPSPITLSCLLKFLSSCWFSPTRSVLTLCLLLRLLKSSSCEKLAPRSFAVENGHSMVPWTYHSPTRCRRLRKSWGPIRRRRSRNDF
jgi:hypothetical protein